MVIIYISRSCNDNFTYMHACLKVGIFCDIVIHILGGVSEGKKVAL